MPLVLDALNGSCSRKQSVLTMYLRDTYVSGGIRAWHFADDIMLTPNLALNFMA
jgi:hypothetical protein